jgi:heterodisulfide reductase subunit A
VVLATPLIQHQAGRDLSPILKVALGSDGFFLEAHPKLRPVEFAPEGLFLCGTAHGPKNVEESMTQALAAASKASIPMAKGKFRTEAVKATVDNELCVGCGACVAICPYNAIEWLSFGQPQVIEAACMGCGLCAAECPMGAMQLKHFKDDQIVPMVNSLFELNRASVLEEEPSIVCFACRWCAYAAADTAGVMRLQYPCSVRLILVPCSGRVDAIHILTAFAKGADGVMIAGCLKEGCHYIDGNIKAEKRVNAMKEALEIRGIGGERVEMFFLSAGMPDKFVESVITFTERINKLPKLRKATQEEGVIHI